MSDQGKPPHHKPKHSFSLKTTGQQEQDTSPKQGKPYVPPLNMSKVEDLLRASQEQPNFDEEFNADGFQGEVLLNEESDLLKQTPQSEIKGRSIES